MSLEKLAGLHMSAGFCEFSVCKINKILSGIMSHNDRYLVVMVAFQYAAVFVSLSAG